MNADPSRGQVIDLAFRLMREDGYDTRSEPPTSLFEYYFKLARAILTGRLC